MKRLHVCAAVFQAAALAFFIWVYSWSGDQFCLFMAGWCMYFGALSTRAIKREGIRA